MTKVVNPNEKHYDCKRAQNETNDCTVLAVASAIGLDYLTAHTLAAQAGRVARKGFFSSRILKEAQRTGWIAGYTQTKMYDGARLQKNHTYGAYRGSSPYPTLAQVMPLLAKGRYVLETGNHAFAVVDGVIYDNNVTFYKPGRYQYRTNSGGMRQRQYVPGRLLDKPEVKMRQRIQSIFEIKLKQEAV